MHPGDWEFVRAIYEEGIATGQATFETRAPSWEDWDRDHLNTPRLVVAASLAVHRQCRFREVGRREKIGRLAGAWRDVILLERRSGRVGRD